MRLSVITVTWNSKDFIVKQIQSVKDAAKNITSEQVVVDNGSIDGTVEVITEKFPEVRLIINRENRGFATANNQGVDITKGDYILFLNPDMILHPGSLDIFVDWMDSNKRVGIASPRLLDKQGKFNWNTAPRRFPRAWEQISIICKLHHVFPSLLDEYRMKGFDSSREQVVDSVQGSCMLVRRELIEKLGHAFDPRYFIWFEDVDLCREAKRLGYNVVYTPIISAIDYSGQSFQKRGFWWKQKRYIVSMMTYFWKWGLW